MLQRHKIPTIFNIYMLDVICCALGCVILLWQVSHQEAVEQTAAAKDAHADAVKQSLNLQTARKKFEQAQTDLLAASSDVSEWRDKYQKLSLAFELTQRERDEARKLAADHRNALDKIRAALALSDEQLRKLEAEHKKSNTDLAATKKINVELLTKIASLKADIALKEADADKQLVALKLSQENARKLEKLLDALQIDVKDAQAKLKSTELLLKVREQDGKDLADLKTLVAALRIERDQYKDKSAAGAKERADLKTLAASLLIERDQYKDKTAAGTKERAALTQRVAALQAEADQRFAGIPLTGENVIFLIDISGSMILKDENEPDPDKWPFLCETLMKLMKSIPSMQRFQVILFSDKTNYLFGNRDKWLKYEGPETATMTRDALKKVKVEGGTNMHDAFDEAFRYRKVKLDTVYLFSDGLPNVGEGLPKDLRNPSEAQRNQHLSKFVRDKLKNDWNKSQAGMNDVRINAVGFFFESPDVGAFLWALAREHRGNFVGLR